MKETIIKLSENGEFGHKFESNETFFIKVQEIVDVLSSAFNLTVDMQRVGYGLSDMYIGWLRVIVNLNRLVKGEQQFDLAKKLLEAMNRRAPSLFESPLVLCSIYLDPRIKFKLDADQNSKAVFDLMKIQERVVSSRLNTEKESDANDTLDEIQAEYKTEHNEDPFDKNRLVKECSIYEEERPYDIKAGVMQFWTENSHKYPLLRQIANLLHAVPSNQCRTEASFSSFTYIRNRYRMAMLPKNVSNILMVRLNKDIYYKLRAERVAKILGQIETTST